LEKIEDYLRENRWRLVDLFASLDKNKDWRVKTSDFILECKQQRLILTESLIEELIMALSEKNSHYLNYKGLARGRSSHLSERRSQLLGNQNWKKEIFVHLMLIGHFFKNHLNRST
jgi:hypothetical protein